MLNSTRRWQNNLDLTKILSKKYKELRRRRRRWGAGAKVQREEVGRSWYGVGYLAQGVGGSKRRFRPRDLASGAWVGQQVEEGLGERT